MRAIAITDRRLCGGGTGALVGRVRMLLGAGVGCVLVREKDLTHEEQATIVRAIRADAAPRGALVLLSDLPELALACGADGVQLGHRSRGVAHARSLAGNRLLIGASCHDAAELAAAARDGADWAMLSPVFAPMSKVATASPLGLDGLAALARQHPGPVVALGGVNAGNAASCLSAGATGVAAIGGLFGQHDEAGVRAFLVAAGALPAG